MIREAVTVAVLRCDQVSQGRQEKAEACSGRTKSRPASWGEKATKPGHAVCGADCLLISMGAAQMLWLGPNKAGASA